MQKVNQENIRSAIKKVIIDLYTNAKNWVMVTEKPYHKVFMDAGIPRKYISDISGILLKECLIEKTGEKRITSYKFNNEIYAKPDFDAITDKVLKGISKHHPSLMVTSRLWGRVTKRSAQVVKFRERPFTIKDEVYAIHADEIVKGKIASVVLSKVTTYEDMDDIPPCYEVILPDSEQFDTHNVFSTLESLLEFMKNKFIVNNK